MEQPIYDVIIVGGGPAGLSAAIYLARARYHVLVLEKETFGGQITITSEVVNYPGVERISGKALTEAMKKQAEHFGAEFLLDRVTSLDLSQEIKQVHTETRHFRALGILLAVGAHPKKIGFPGEKEFQGKGVAYCATCDGEFFTGMDIFVVGGGYAAAEEALFLTRYAKQVVVLVRGEAFRCARSIADEVMSHPKIEVRFRTEVEAVGGDAVLSWAKFVNHATGETSLYRVPAGSSFGLFVFAGYEPDTAWLSDAIQLDKNGYILTGPDQRTNQPGVYAAGDVCVKPLRQVVTAVSDGALAATSLERYVSEIRKRRNLPPAEMPSLAAPGPEPTSSSSSGADGAFLDADTKEQLRGLFSKFEKKVQVRAYLDSGSLSAEMNAFMKEISSISDKIVYMPSVSDEMEAPALVLFTQEGKETGIAFHGVPGGHEFNSFVIALYNAAGPGQPLDSALKERIRALPAHTIKVMVSLSCTMCPEMVMAAQRIASLSDSVTAHMYDLSHFPAYRETYHIMSVPCTIIDDEKVIFGKHSTEELIQALESKSHIEK